MIKLKSLLSERFEGVVYRGDDTEFAEFDNSKIGRKGYDTVGFWFSDNKEAAGFYGEHVRKFKIKMENPMVVSDKQFADNYPHGPAYWANLAKQKNNDGVILTNIVDGDMVSNVYCVFDKSQIEFN